jgi:hypothetical protein
VITQQLRPLPHLGYRVPHLAILRSSQAVRNNIREKKIAQLENTMGMASRQNMFTFERYRNEYLLRKKDFTPPWQIFRASKDEEKRKENSLPKISGNGTSYPLESRDPESRDKENALYPWEKNTSRNSDKKSMDNAFSIEGEPSLEDVLQEISHRDN